MEALEIHLKRFQDTSPTIVFFLPFFESPNFHECPLDKENVFLRF